MQKIAVFGGTFNPIHNGHIHLVKEFSKRLGFDQVLLVPSRVPPHKQAKDLASAADRLAMCRLAALEFQFEVSEIEIERRGFSYTSDTLRELKRIYPDAELYFITGEDMFLTLANWHNAKCIFSLATLCAAPRSYGGMEKLLEYSEILRRGGAKTAIENIDYLPISSTMVRVAVKQGKNLAGLVPAAVAEYIIENNLYLERKP
jgi:nicotinate-nucleotide adenylyltransferase